MPPGQTESLKIVPLPTERGARQVRLEGELDIATSPSLRACLRQIEPLSLELDLGGLWFTDSTGLATLLEARARTVRHGATLRLRGARGQTRELLERTGVLSLFEAGATPR
jgi:anti-anti-sigma factor